MSQGKPLILLPCEPVNPRQIDPDFEPEWEAAKAAGLDTALIDHSRVLEGAAAAAVARTPEGAGTAVYQGWMLKPNQYEAMHAAPPHARESGARHRAPPSRSLSRSRR
jgi:hypothetical protein